MAKLNISAVAMACLTATLLLAGCATSQPEAPCVDISGVYVPISEPTGTPLANVLAPDHPVPARMARVSIVAGADGRTIEVRFDTERLELRRGADYTCQAQGLRLVKPSVATFDLGVVFGQRVSTFNVLSKAQDGSLQADRSIQEQATVGGVPLSGPQRAATAIRWRSLR